jgi:hypothetical protein
MYEIANSFFHILMQINRNRISEDLLYIHATSVGFKPLFPFFKWYKPCSTVSCLYHCAIKMKCKSVECVVCTLQAEECALRACVDRFNNRRYNTSSRDPDFEPSDHCITSVLGQPFELTDYFKQHYEVWLQREVFQTSFGDFY